MTQKPHTIVVGVDFTRASDVALIEALRLAALGAACSLHVVYVADPRELPEDPDKSSMEQAEAVLERAPDHLRLRLLDVAGGMGIALADVETYVHVRLGDHAETLLQVAVDYDADLLVVGTHDRGFVDRLVLGSVSEKLVRHAHCPVLVARPTDYAGLTKTARSEKTPRGRQQSGDSELHEVSLHTATQRVEWSGTDRDGPNVPRRV